MNTIQFFILILILNSFLFQQYKDTDCYQSAGNSADECKKFTTFVDGDPIEIEEKVLYLCCYVNTEEYQGCKPIKEDIVFGDNKEHNFDCNSNFNKLKFIFVLLSFINIF